MIFKKSKPKAGILIAATPLVALATALALAAAPSPKLLQAFRQECAQKASAAEKSGRIAAEGMNGWLFFGPELHYVSVGKFWGPAAAKVSRATSPAYADPLPALLDFKKQLDKAGIELLLVPVPPKAIIYPDALSKAVSATSGAPPRLDPDSQAFYALLRKNSVHVLDLTAAFLANRSGTHGAVFCKQDTHWSGKACVLAAERIAATIKNRPWLKSVPKRKYSAEWKTVTINGDLRESLGAGAPPKESLPLRFVGVKSGGSLAPVEPSKTSPILLLGDSHNLIFHAGGDMQAKGAGLADQLAYDLGIPVDLIAVRGSGATPARISLFRRVRSDSNYLKGKKLVIWCLGAREFTESSGWRKVPIVK